MWFGSAVRHRLVLLEGTVGAWPCLTGPGAAEVKLLLHTSSSISCSNTQEPSVYMSLDPRLACRAARAYIG